MRAGKCTFTSCASFAGTYTPQWSKKRNVAVGSSILFYQFSNLFYEVWFRPYLKKSDLIYKSIISQSLQLSVTSYMYKGILCHWSRYVQAQLVRIHPRGQEVGISETCSCVQLVVQFHTPLEENNYEFIRISKSTVFTIYFYVFILLTSSNSLRQFVYIIEIYLIIR